MLRCGWRWQPNSGPATPDAPIACGASPLGWAPDCGQLSQANPDPGCKPTPTQMPKQRHVMLALLHLVGQAGPRNKGVDKDAPVAPLAKRRGFLRRALGSGSDTAGSAPRGRTKRKRGEHAL